MDVATSKIAAESLSNAAMFRQVRLDELFNNKLRGLTEPGYTNREIFMAAHLPQQQSSGAVFTNNNSGTFTPCTTGVRNFVLDTYLKRKMANYLGERHETLLWGTPVKFTAPYANDEGVIKGLDVEAGVKGLRIDLQKAQVIKVGGVDQTYACLQVQWGTGMNGTTGGAYAGALIRCGSVFSLATLREALEKSFAWGKYCRVDPGASR